MNESESTDAGLDGDDEPATDPGVIITDRGTSLPDGTRPIEGEDEPPANYNDDILKIR